jgi:hypothetical protein
MGFSMRAYPSGPMRSYLSELERMAAQPAAGAPEHLSKGGALRQAQDCGSLHDRFVQWYAALPTLTRNRPFAMVEIERALGTRGRFISPVLIRLGWRRQRIWTGAGPFHRYWLPPPG